MRIFLYALFCLFTFNSYADQSAQYKVQPGGLHRKGKITVSVMPEKDKYMVKMEYNVTRKDFVPVPAKLLKGTKIMEFPQEFRTEKGYKELESKKKMSIPKAELVFIKKADIENLKGAYFFEVRPTNKKSKIDIIYHPSLPSVGWLTVDITFISSFPILNGYQLEARLQR